MHLQERRSPRASLKRTDVALVRATLAGDRDAGDELIRRYWDAAYRTAYLVTLDSAASEDIAQEAMLSALRALAGYDPKRPYLPWLRQIVVNGSRDWLRLRARRAEIDLSGRQVPAAPHQDFADSHLYAALARLDHERRLLIAMRYILGYSEAEIAETLQIPRGTVGSRLRRGLDQMRESLEDEQ